MPDRDFASEKEFFAGRKADGSKPTYHSRQFYDGATQLFSDLPALPPVGDEKRSPREIEADRLHYEVDMRRMRDLDDAADYAREMMALGRQGMRATACPEPVEGVRERDCPRSSDEEDADDPPEAKADPLPDPADGENRTTIPDIRGIRGVSENSFSRVFDARSGAKGAKSGIGVTPMTAVQPRPDLPDTPRKAKGGHRPEADATFLSRSQMIAIGMQGSKLLVSISIERAQVAHLLIDRATKLDVRKSFMENRAVAVVYQTLLHCDEQFSELGFGAWMPFRWPDQWLSFTGLLSRVLAANGLIHSKYADIYRKLLDETPPVGCKGTIEERIKEARTPHNLALCPANQGAYTMSELKKRLKTELWEPKEEFEKTLEEFWEQQMIKPRVVRAPPPP